MIERLSGGHVVLHQSSEKDRQRILRAGHEWLVTAEQKEKQALDLRMQQIFNHMHQQIESFLSFVKLESIGDGRNGREVWLACEKEKIKAMAWGCTGASESCQIWGVFENPNRLPSTMGQLNHSTEEGFDSFLFRSVVERATDSYISTNIEPLQEQGYKNIFGPIDSKNDYYQNNQYVKCREELLRNIQLEQRVPQFAEIEDPLF